MSDIDDLLIHGYDEPMDNPQDTKENYGTPDMPPEPQNADFGPVTDAKQAIQALELTAKPVSVEDMILRGIDRGLPVDTMERLLAMRRELKAEMAKEAFDKAMAAFQRQCPAIRKTKQVFEKNNPTKVRYSYAPLESVIAQIKESVALHGFSYTVDAEVEILAERPWVTALCKVTHSAGHSQVSKFKVPIDKDAYMNEAQKFASALTFTKRYAFISAFGIMTADEDDDSQSSADQNAPPSRQDAPGKANAAPKAQRDAPTLKMVPAVTAESKTKLLAILRENSDLESIAREFFEKCGALLPTENLDDLPLTHCPATVAQKDALIHAIGEFATGGEARLPYPLNSESITKNKSEHKAAPPTGLDAPYIQTIPNSNDAQKQPWYGHIVPVPRKGQTRDEYLKAPDTIGSLYEARHGTDDLAQEARQRLYGFLNNYEAKGWTKRDGTPMPPNESDKKFRMALDQFGDWWEQWHKGEKI